MCSKLRRDCDRGKGTSAFSRFLDIARDGFDLGKFCKKIFAPRFYSETLGHIIEALFTGLFLFLHFWKERTNHFGEGFDVAEEHQMGIVWAVLP